MSKIDFSYLNKDLVVALKDNGVEERDLFNYHGDLYVGCHNKHQAENIKSAGVWRGLTSLFTPQKDSDMDRYPIALDIGLGAMQYDYQTKFKKNGNNR